MAKTYVKDLKTPLPEHKLRRCVHCFYYDNERDFCEYILITGKMRGTSGENCDKFMKKLTWRRGRSRKDTLATLGVGEDES